MPVRTRLSLGAIATIGIVALAVRADSRQLQGSDEPQRALFQPAGKANVIVFVSSDCPIANGYAPEIQRIHASTREKGVTWTLVYEDVSIDAAATRAHRDQYGYRGIASVIDLDGTIARRAGATVTPEAVVVVPGGAVKYRGRIDNKYIAIGKARQVVTVHDLRDSIEAVLAGRAVAHAQTEAFGCFIPSRRYTP